MRKIGLLFSVIAFFAIFGCEKDEKSTIASEIVGTYDGSFNDSTDFTASADISELTGNTVNVKIYSKNNEFNAINISNLLVTRYDKDSSGGYWLHYTLENDSINWGQVSLYEEENLLSLDLSFNYKYFSGLKKR